VTKKPKPRKKSDFNLITERLLVYPKDNTTKEAKSFWIRENKFFQKLFKKFPDYKFWKKVSFKGSLITNGKLPSYVLFFDKDNDYWINLLNKKWKNFYWKPRKVKRFKSKKDVDDEIVHKPKKRSIRNFLS
jgi:hypothetical protein